MKDISDRLSTYEPLWENWYKDEFLGGGNFGRVYRLKQDFFGNIRYSAVKIIPILLDQELSMRTSGRDTLINERKDLVVEEIKNMHKLGNTPRLVHCLNYAIKDIYDDMGEVIGFDVLIHMDHYISLPKFMKANGSLNDTEAETLAYQIGTALRAMHDINMLHRDIKPENIYVDKNCDFLLGDFGVSKQVDSSSYSTLAGTQPFIAPEVWKVQQTNKRYSNTADIYSYGITLYYLMNDNMLPLVTPNSTQNDIENAVFDRLNGKEFPPPLHGPEYLKAIIMKCCRYSPDERYQDVKELLRDLQTQNAPAIQAQAAPAPAPAVDMYKTVYADDSVPQNGGVQQPSQYASQQFPQNGSVQQQSQYVSQQFPQYGTQQIPNNDSQQSTAQVQAGGAKKKSKALPAVIAAVVLLGGGGVAAWKITSDNNSSSTKSSKKDRSSSSEAAADDSKPDEDPSSSDDTSVYIDESSVYVDDSSEYVIDHSEPDDQSFPDLDFGYETYYGNSYSFSYDIGVWNDNSSTVSGADCIFTYIGSAADTYASSTNFNIVSGPAEYGLTAEVYANETYYSFLNMDDVYVDEPYLFTYNGIDWYELDIEYDMDYMIMNQSQIYTIQNGNVIIITYTAEEDAYYTMLQDFLDVLDTFTIY